MTLILSDKLAVNKDVYATPLTVGKTALDIVIVVLSVTMVTPHATLDMSLGPIIRSSPRQSANAELQLFQPIAQTQLLTALLNAIDQ